MPDIACPCAKAAIDRLLASSPSQRQVNIRLSAVEKLLAQTRRFYPWPALETSLMADARRLRDRREQLRSKQHE